MVTKKVTRDRASRGARATRMSLPTPLPKGLRSKRTRARTNPDDWRRGFTQIPEIENPQDSVHERSPQRVRHDRSPEVNGPPPSSREIRDGKRRDYEHEDHQEDNDNDLRHSYDPDLYDQNTLMQEKDALICQLQQQLKEHEAAALAHRRDRKSTRLNSSHRL